MLTCSTQENKPNKEAKGLGRDGSFPCVSVEELFRDELLAIVEIIRVIISGNSVTSIALSMSPLFQAG